MSEESKRKNKEQDKDLNNLAEDNDRNAIKKVSQYVDSRGMTNDDVEEGIYMSLKKCYNLIEKQADIYFADKDDLSAKYREVNLMKSNARKDLLNRVLTDGISNIDVIVLDVAQNITTPIIPIEDVKSDSSRETSINSNINSKGIITENLSNLQFSNNINELFNGISEESIQQENIKQMARIAAGAASILATNASSGTEITPHEKAYVVRDLIKLSELAKKGDQAALQELHNISMKYDFDITTISNDKNINIKEETMRELINKSAEEVGMDPKEFEMDALKELETDQNAELKQGARTLKQEIESMNESQLFDFVFHGDSKDVKEWARANIESAKNFKEKNAAMGCLEQFKEKLDILEYVLEIEVKFKDAMNNNAISAEKLTELSKENLEGAQMFLKDFLTDENQSVQDYQNKIMTLQESIKEAEKERLKEAFDKDDERFKQDIIELVSFNPIVAQEFLQEFLQDGTKTVAEYGTKISFLQDSISMTLNDRTTSKEKDAISVDKVEIEKIRGNISLTEDKKAQIEDEELSL